MVTTAAGSSLTHPGARAGLRRWWPVPVLGAWTAFVWLTRISNVSADAEAGVATKAWTIALSLSLLGLAAAAVVVVVRAWRREPSSGERVVLQVLAGWTTLVWIVRATGIAIADHDVPFKVVHLVLGVVSIVLAALTWRAAVSPAREASR